MFTTQFNKVLLFNPIRENSPTEKGQGEYNGRFQKVQHRKYENSVQTIQKIKDAGLDCDIDDVIEVEKKYRIQKIVGYGATSVVYKAHQSLTDDDVKSSKIKQVAIKKIKNIFKNDIYDHHILRELRLLRILRGHKNII